MIALSFALIVCAGVAIYAIHRWSAVEIARQQTMRTISDNARAASERMERFFAVDPASIATVTRPHFGQKPHVAVDNDQPGGDAA